MSANSQERGIISRFKRLVSKESVDRHAPVTGFLRECAADAISRKERGEDKFDIVVATAVLSVATIGIDAVDALVRYIGRPAK